MIEKNIFKQEIAKQEMKKIKIPEWELDISFARSGGPGGQNVNKLNTKAVLHFNIDSSKTLSAEEKNIIKEKLANHINNDGELVLQNQESHSQYKNRGNVVRKLNELINDALTPEKERIETDAPERVKEKRLKDKKKKAEIKKMRGKMEIE